MREVKDKKGFLKYVNRNMKTRKNIGSLQNEQDGKRGHREGRVTNAFFASSLYCSDYCMGTPDLEARERVRGKEDFHLVREDLVRDI